MAAFEGSLESTPLSDVLKKIALQRREGLLTLSWKENRVFAQCKDGEVVRAWEGEEEVLLGELLVRAGKMTPERLENGLRIQKNINQPLTRTMVEMGYVTPEEIKRLTRILSEETLYPVFNWPTGRFSFELKSVEFDPGLIAPLATDLIIREGNRQADAWPGLLKKIPSLQIVFEQTLNGLEELEESECSTSRLEGKREATQVILDRTIRHLKMEEGKAVNVKDDLAWLTALIDGKGTVHEIIQKSETMAFSAFSVYSGLSELMDRKIIKVKDNILERTVEAESKTVAVIPHHEIKSELSIEKIEKTSEATPVENIQYHVKHEENTKHEHEIKLEEEVNVFNENISQRDLESSIGKIRDKIGLLNTGSIVSAITTRKLMVNGVAIAVSAIFIFIAYPSILQISQVGQQVQKAIEPITRSSDLEGIQIALDLYYLKYAEFPHSLNDLIRAGFLIRQKVDLSDWKYRRNQNGYVLSESKSIGQVVIQE